MCQTCSLGHEMRVISNLLRRRMETNMRRKGIDKVTVMHGWIIGYLYEHRQEDVFQKDIETQFSIARSTVTNILQLMEKKGYIQRVEVPIDARLKKLVLTSEGLRIHQLTMRSIDEVEQDLIAGLSKKDVDYLSALLKKLECNLQPTG